MNILVKFPTRERPDKFIHALRLTKELANHPSKLQFLVSVDNNDRLKATYVNYCKRDNIPIYLGDSKHKIDACNRDIDKAKDWDIVVLLSDDMICQVKGWDDILRREIQQHFPDTDGVLFHNDGYLGKRLNTMVIIGRKYYKGYLYYPGYGGFCCDAEFMLKSQLENKSAYFDQVLFKHEHPQNNRTVKNDILYIKNDIHYVADVPLYKERYKRLFT